MSENHTDCERFEALLLDDASDPNLQDSNMQAWHRHLEDCSECRQQWVAHQMLVATFDEVPVPELSPAFEAGLQRKIDFSIEVKPLAGWRRVAMIGYALLAIGLMGWVFKRFPLPPVSIDPASPWIMALAIAAVPLTLWLTIGLSRWLPAKRSNGLTQLSLL